jgi:hypothetical protein
MSFAASEIEGHGAVLKSTSPCRLIIDINLCPTQLNVTSLHSWYPRHSVSIQLKTLHLREPMHLIDNIQCRANAPMNPLPTLPQA